MSSVVTGVLVGAGTFYSVSVSILETVFVTTLAVPLAVLAPMRGRRRGR
jgi:hypothetical protein